MNADSVAHVLNEIAWQRQHYTQLSTDELFGILQARQAVFVIEQNCVYPDIDDKDKRAWHLSGSHNGRLVAYARILGPNESYQEPSIGRVLTDEALRGSNIGRALVHNAIELCHQEYPAQAIRIGAQFHLKKFYSSLGFTVASDPYIEDGIRHIEMLLAAT